jgi:ADP-dependent NAD(P)H-hydrate dehydratase
MPPASAITPAALREWPLPSADGSKHSRGHVLVVGGSRRNPGGAMLSGLASLRVGAGVLAMAVPDTIALALAVAVPEAGVSGLSDEAGSDPSDADAVLIGPGFDDPDVTKAVLQQIVGGLADEANVVLDAFALGVLPELPNVSDRLQERMILTPNSREAERLLGDEELSEDDGSTAQAIAERYRCTVSYQGFVAGTGQPLREIATGHSGLGTSGSGDVLAGAVAGLLARGAAPDQAACWGTYLHAAAGDRLAARVGRLGFLARELTEELPLVLTELLS